MRVKHYGRDGGGGIREITEEDIRSKESKN